MGEWTTGIGRVPQPEQTTVPIGGGDDLDVAAGRCCPTCRHDLTPHNVAVWNAGYSVATRHAESSLAEAWWAGWAALSREYQRQREDPTYPIGEQAQNPYLPEGRVHP